MAGTAVPARRAFAWVAAAMMSACAGDSGVSAKIPATGSVNLPPSVGRKEVQKQIAALLFNIPLADIEIAVVGASYDYNNFGEGAEAETTCTGYAGGHAGTDFQTKDVEGPATADRGVFSLTRGEVLSTDAATGRVLVKASMDVDGRNEEVKVGYLHLRSIAVSAGDKIAQGERMGVQGNLGLGLSAADTTTREHVHVEFRAAAAPNGAACGASPHDEKGDARFGALDPQKYFVSIVTATVPK